MIAVLAVLSIALGIVLAGIGAAGLALTSSGSGRRKISAAVLLAGGAFATSGVLLYAWMAFVLPGGGS